MFQNQLGQPYSKTVGSKFTVLFRFTLYLRAIFQVQAPEGARGLIFGRLI